MKNNDQLDMEMSRLNKARDEYHYFGDNRKTGLFWKPYWQRKNGQNENRFPTSTLSRNYRLLRREATLHQSYQDLRSHRSSQKLYLPKSISMGGLHSTPYVLQNTDMNKKPHSNNILAFSQLDSSPEITMIHPSEVEERSERNNDENKEASQPCENQNESAEKIVQEDENEEEEENDIYLSDDDPVVSRENLDKAGTYLVEHDWMLKSRLEKDSKRLIRSHKKLRIPIPDDDPLDTIQNRLEEISLMVKSKAKRSNQLDTMDPEQRTRIMKFKHLSSQQIRDQRRRDFKAIDRFRDAVLMVLLLHRASRPRKKYLHVNEAETAPGALKRMKEKTDWENQNTSKSTLGMEMQLALSTQPEYRSPADLKRVTWILRATKAFQHLFPSQLEGELARVLAYERYEDRRIVAYQGEQPERFYYILRGELQKVKEYRLMSGVISRNEGFIRKGSTTDPEEMEHQWPREHHLVTKGPFECLILERLDFLRLQHTSKGPPVDFLQSLDLFKEFPCDELVTHPESLQFKYYAKDMMIVKDTHRTPWIHIVKTGTVRVVRIQNVLDVHNDALFASQTAEELGCKRTFSHAKSMIGTLEKQRKNKQASANAVSFPEITRRHKHLADSGSPKSHSVSTEGEAQTEATVVKPERKKPKLMKSPIIVDPFGGRNSAKTRPSKLPDIIEDSANYESESVMEDKNKESESLSQNGIAHKQERVFFLPPIPNAESKPNENRDYQPHGTYLTRERTDFDPVYSRKLRKEPSFRKAYLQLDVLRVGDIFGMETIAESLRAKASVESDDTGLEHLEPPLASEAPGVSLISDGAEVIRISKRFFLQFAKNNTMLKVETMQREYMSPDEARSILYEKETWDQYKSVLLQKTVENIAKKKLEAL